MRTPRFLPVVIAIAALSVWAADSKAASADDPVGPMAATNALMRGSESERARTIEAVLAQPNRYAPVVFYALAHALFAERRKDDAMFWFYAGQLRARYDANRCTDKSAGSIVGILNQQTGEDINRYAFQDRAKLRKTVQGVLAWDEKTPHDYDLRWLVGPAGKGVVDESTWPEIERKTRETWSAGFRTAMGDDADELFADPKARALVDAARADDVARISALIASGADVNARGVDDVTPLCVAYLAGSRQAIARLMDAGANPAVEYKRLRVSVLEAALHESTGADLRLLLEHKLDPNALTARGEPLLLALPPGPEDLPKTRLLVERGADANAANSFGATVLSHAAMMRQYQVVLYLLDHGADPARRDRAGNDLAAWLFHVPNLTASAETERRQVIAKLAARGYKVDETLVAQARIRNLDEATGRTPPMWLHVGDREPNPAWIKVNPAEAEAWYQRMHHTHAPAVDGATPPPEEKH